MKHELGVQADDAVTKPAQLTIAALIRGPPMRVIAAIHFDDEPVRPHRGMSSSLPRHRLAIAHRASGAPRTLLTASGDAISAALGCSTAQQPPYAAGFLRRCGND